MAAIAIQTPTAAGVAFTTQAAAGGGDTFVNDGKTVLYVANGGGVSITVTLTPQNTLPGGVALAAIAVAVAAAQAKMIGPVPQQYFNNANGAAVVTYSGVATVTVAALSVGN